MRGSDITEIRERLGLTVSDLAVAFDRSRTWVYQVEAAGRLTSHQQAVVEEGLAMLALEALRRYDVLRRYVEDV